MIRRGWCPTLDRPMRSGDGLLVRVQPWRATLTPDQVLALAAAAARFGNGVLELTLRGNLQIRGLLEATLPGFAAAMQAAGVPGPGALLVPPLLGVDAALDPRTEGLVARLERAFASDARLQGLPGKFAVVVDGGGVLGGRTVAADLVAHADGRLEGAGGVTRPAPVGDLGCAFGVAPPLGQFTADMLAGLADVAARAGGTVRTTPWRALLVTGGGRVAGAGWITDPDDKRLLVTACVGAPGCAQATVAARADAAVLRPSRPVHVSGCAKGCAHPGAARTLVGRDGLYDLVAFGRASDPPERTGLSFADASA